jgi:hypothetical protein
MAQKTVLVSDITGHEISDPVVIKMFYDDGTVVELDANASEVTGWAEMGRRSRRRGRPRKKPEQETPEAEQPTGATE